MCLLRKSSVDEIKLKKCACNLVKYCCVECQKNHRPHHYRECKKRLAEIRDDNLYRQPDESHHGDCPICCLPLPLDTRKSTLKSCCCKLICNGCDYANIIRERERGLDHKCPYCREPVPENDEEANQHYMERAKANDPVALNMMGVKCQEEGDYEGAFEYYTKAAALDDGMAHYNLSGAYRDGRGVEKDLKKEVYHLEEAAIGGHPNARHLLGCYEGGNGRDERAMRHFIIAAKHGRDEALDFVKMGFMNGFVSKEDYAAALRGHQDAVDATKSKQRDEAYASGFYEWRETNN